MAPDFQLTETDGALTGASFEVTVKGGADWPPSCQERMMLSVLSYVCAWEEFGFAPVRRDALMKRIQSHPFQDYSFTEAGVSVACDVEYSGYTAPADAATLWPQSGESQSYSLRFTMERADG